MKKKFFFYKSFGDEKKKCFTVPKFRNTSILLTRANFAPWMGICMKRNPILTLLTNYLVIDPLALNKHSSQMQGINK